MTTVRTFEDFCKKYGITENGPALDQDLSLAGFQNDTFPIEEIANDFISLNYDDRYAALKALELNHDTALLKIILAVPKTANRKTIFEAADKFYEKISDLAFMNDDTWEVRYSIAEGMFILGAMLALAPETEQKNIRNHIRKVLCKLYNELYNETIDQGNAYKQSGHLFLQKQNPLTNYGKLENFIINLPDYDNNFVLPSIGIEMCDSLDNTLEKDNPQNNSTNFKRNKYFDTDGDLNPFKLKKENWNYCFDDLDVDPRDNKFIFDADKDGVADELDAAVGSEWSSIPVGKTKKFEACDIRRDKSGKHTIIVKLYLASEDKSCQKNLKNPAFLAKLKKSIEKFYKDNCEGIAKDINIDIQFVTDIKKCHHYVFIGGTERSSSKRWAIEDLAQSEVMLHEIFHLLGLHDYYHEALVSGGIRDHTFAPGFTEIDPDNIMRSRFMIRRWQLQKIIQLAAQSKKEEKTESPKEQLPDSLPKIVLDWLNLKIKLPFEKYFEEFKKLYNAGGKDNPYIVFSYMQAAASIHKHKLATELALQLLQSGMHEKLRKETRIDLADIALPYFLKDNKIEEAVQISKVFANTEYPADFYNALVLLKDPAKIEKYLKDIKNDYSPYLEMALTALKDPDMAKEKLAALFSKPMDDEKRQSIFLTAMQLLMNLGKTHTVYDLVNIYKARFELVFSDEIIALFFQLRLHTCIVDLCKNHLKMEPDSHARFYLLKILIKQGQYDEAAQELVNYMAAIELLKKSSIEPDEELTKGWNCFLSSLTIGERDELIVTLQKYRNNLSPYQNSDNQINLVASWNVFISNNINNDEKINPKQIEEADKLRLTVSKDRKYLLRDKNKQIIYCNQLIAFLSAELQSQT